ncbi:MAG: beta-ketoacyl-[acyl-carrier-protein] synthase family protein [Desulfovibrio sp.]|jgi:3-oxoacyl-[acyl-carrier-protein] synthase II|nr:beta-ketoacyl-[acyl-carrier-protein] synthase family protein [Desulfovibrio sp.]
MQLKRVAVTGMGAVSPYGRGAGLLFDSMLSNKSGIRYHEELERFESIGPRVAGIVTGIDMMEIPRKRRRSMSPMSVYALLAAQEAATQAALSREKLADGRTGLIMGSTMGSVHAIEGFFRDYLADGKLDQVKSTLFFQVMGHSAASNVAQAMGINGRVLAPTAACATSCQAIGLAYEAVAFGRQDIVLCGGADEYHPLTTGTFDMLLAASASYNETPQRTPRPFDRDRDGTVCSEGAGVLVLESFESAEKRDVPVLAEVAGFSSVCDTGNIANPDPEPLYRCMLNALDDAGLKPGDVSYVNAHATATVQGDIAEAKAIALLAGDKVPVSSLKGHLGHTMAAAGVLESIACVDMLRREVLLPTLNLDNQDPQCGGISLPTSPGYGRISVIVKNNFALGGVNCSLVLRAAEN